MEKKNAQPRNAELSAIKNSAKCTTLSPREARTLTALAHTQDWISREALDRIACASNGPAVVQALRRKLGSPDAIEMQRMAVTDADGKTAQAGRYRLANQRRAQAVALLQGGCHAGATAQH